MGSRARRLSGIPLILLFCALALSGCGRTQTEAGAGGKARDPKTEPTLPPAEVRVYEDEAMLKGSRAVIGGTLENVAGRRLEDLVVELELRKRDGGQVEIRQIPVTPKDLEPGGRGRYSIAVLSREWSSARVNRLRSGGQAREELAFQSTRGALRPAERPPTGKLVVVPRPRSQGEEFINSPDNPDAIR